MRQPWFRERDGWWYVSVKVNGKLKQHKLSRDKEEAWKIWRSLDTSPSSLGGISLLDVFSRWLAWSERRKAPSTLTWYANHLRSFMARYGNSPCRDLKPHHVTGYIAETKPGWAKERAIITALKSILNWGVQQGLIEKNTISSVKRPPAKRRDYLPEKEVILSALSGANQQLRLVLTALYELGCRQSAVRTVTAKHFVPAMEAWVFHPSEHKTGRTGRPLVVNLTPGMVAMTKMLIQQYPEGPLFRNSLGRPWKKDAIKDAIRKLRKRLGLPEKFVATSFRHGFATDGLMSGLGAETMAQLLGHTDSSMVNRHYGHLDQKARFLSEQLRKLDAGRRISESSPDSPPEKPESEPPPAGHPDS